MVGLDRTLRANMRAAVQEEAQQQLQRVDQQDRLGHSEDAFHDIFDDPNALWRAEGLDVVDAASAR
jgi:hypothetical protein